MTNYARCSMQMQQLSPYANVTFLKQTLLNRNTDRSPIALPYRDRGVGRSSRGI